MLKTIEQRTEECREFQKLFAQVLPAVGERLSQQYPLLQVVRHKTVGAGTRILAVELTEPCLVVEQFCAKQSELIDSLAFFPSYDSSDTLRYVDHPDHTGFTDPAALAEHCIKWLLFSVAEQ